MTRRRLCLSLASILLATASLRAEYLSVHIGYVVPDSRTAQPQAVENLRDTLLQSQAWFAEQMDLWGFGPKTFRLQTDAGLPTVHVVSTAKSPEMIRENMWGETLGAAGDAGLPIWAPGEVWFLIGETHEMMPDGSISGGYAGGASFGSGDDAGTVLMGGDTLFRFDTDKLTDLSTYAGMTFPELGPHPAVEDITFPWFEQDTISSVSSSVQGAAAHELGHAFGLPHNFMNDVNFHGNLMGNGLRGIRGNVHPDLFPQDEARLGYAAALALSTSPYFNFDQRRSDKTKPTLDLLTTGDVDPVAGLLEIEFSATDDGELPSAVLLRNGEVIGQMPLSGASVSETFATPYYDAGERSDFEVQVYDAQGNRQTQTRPLTPATGFNRAPQPQVRLARSTITLGDQVLLDASRSADPDDASSSLLFEWDFDGDGVFDTTARNDPTLVTTFAAAGIGRIVARVTDPSGASAVSAPIAYRVTAASGDFDADGDVDGADFLAIQRTNPTLIPQWEAEFGTRAVKSTVAAVPEPCAFALIVAMIVGVPQRRRRWQHATATASTANYGCLRC